MRMGTLLLVALVVAVALVTRVLGDVSGTPYWWTSAIASAPCSANATAVSQDGLTFVATCSGGTVGVAGYILDTGAQNWTATNVFNSTSVQFVALVALSASSSPNVLLVLGTTAVVALNPWTGSLVQTYWLPSWVAPPLAGLVLDPSPPGNLVPLYTTTMVFALNTSEVGGAAAFKPFFNLTSASESIAFQPMIATQPASVIIPTTARRAFVLPLPTSSLAPLPSYDSLNAGYFSFAANTSALSLSPVLYKDVALLGGVDGYLGWFSYGDVLASNTSTNASHVSFAGASRRSAIKSVCVAMSTITNSAFSLTAVWGDVIGIFDMFDGGDVVLNQTIPGPNIAPNVGESLDIITVPRPDSAAAAALVIVNASSYIRILAPGTATLVANFSLEPYTNGPLQGYSVVRQSQAVYLLFSSALVAVNASVSAAVTVEQRTPIIATGFGGGGSLSRFPSGGAGVVFVANATTLQAVSVDRLPNLIPAPPPPPTATPVPPTASPSTPSPPNATETPSPANITAVPVASTAAPNATETPSTASPPNATESPSSTTTAPSNGTSAPGTESPTTAPSNATEAPNGNTTNTPSGNVTTAPSGNGTTAPSNVTAAPNGNTTAVPTTPSNGILFTATTTTALNVSGRTAFAQKLIAALNGTSEEIELEFGVGTFVEFSLVGPRDTMLAAALESLTPEQLLALGIVSLTRGTFAPSTTGSPSNGTGGPATAAPSTGTAAPSTAAPGTPQPSLVPIKTYTATFNRTLTLAEKNLVLAAVAALLHLNSTVNIQLLPSDDSSVVFRFTGPDASALSAAFDSIPNTEKQLAMGYTSLSAATDGPASSPDTGLDERSKVIIIVCATVGGILVIGVVGYCVVSSKRKGHVPFDDYVQMDSQTNQRLDVPINYRPETGTGYGSYRV